MKHIYSYILVTFIAFSANNLFSQGTNCATAEPFCTSPGVPYSYSNVTGFPDLTDVGCLLSVPNQSWFYIKTSAAGAMTYSLTQSSVSPGGTPDLDVDFIAYGPYTAAQFPTACSMLTGTCTADHACTGNVEDCSYSIASTETMTLTPTAAGQYFIIMITNYENSAGFITFTQTGGAGSDCAITCPADNFTLEGTNNTTSLLVASGSTLNCSQNITLDPPNLGGFSYNPFTDQLTPCLQVYIDPFTTNIGNNGSIHVFENGVNYWRACPSASCSANVGGTSATNGNPFGWYLGQVDPNFSHPSVFCRTTPISGTTPTVTLRSCWDKTVILAGPQAWSSTSCFTLTAPASPTAYGSASFSIAPTTGSVGLTDSNWGQAALTPSLIPSGTYTVTYSFNNNVCGVLHGYYVFTIPATPTISAASAVSQTVCGGSAVAAENFSLTPAGSFNWTNSNTGIGVAASGSANIASYTAPNVTTTTIGNFTVTPTSSGCIGSPRTFTITIEPKPTLTISTAPTTICLGSAFSYTFSGANTYSVVGLGSVPATGSYTPPASGTIIYTINATSAAGCTNTAITSVTVNPTPTVAISSVSSPTICSGNNSTITPSGASTYTLLNSGATGTSFNVSPTSTTTYSIVGTSASSCPSTNTITTTITVNATPTIAIGSITSNTICSGQSVTITPSGASSSYTLNPGGLTATPFVVSPGSTTGYTISGTNTGGCISTAGTNLTTTITVNATPTIAIGSITSNTICSGQSVTITPSGASSGNYTLTPGGSTASPFVVTPGSTTSYTINGSNSNGCISTTATDLNTTITVNATPTIAIGSITSNTICSGQSVTITPSGASASYTLNPGGLTATPFVVTPGSTTGYTISGTNTGGCISTTITNLTTTITVNATPTIAIGSITSNTICSGQSVTITPSGASSSYTLNPGGLTATPFVVSPGSTTSYTINGTNSNGCISTTATDLNTTITVNTTPTIAIGSITSNTICSGQSVTITPSGASASYTLNPGGSTTTPFVVNPSSTTGYTISGTNTGGCISTTATNLTTTITVNATPTIAIGSITSNTICSGQSVTITPSGANTSYTLLPGGSTTSPFVVTPGSTTGYTLSGTNSNGCISTAATNLTTTITVNATPTIAIGSITSNTICSGQSVTITPSGANTSYTLLPGGSTTSPFVVSPGSTTSYTINGTNSNGCISTTATDLNTTITVNSTPTIAISSITSNTICSEQSVTITPSGASASYTLNPGGITATPFVVNPSSTTGYTISGTNTGGCVSTAATNLTTTITVNATPTIAIGSITSNTICSGQSVTITPSGANTSYTLLPGGSTTSPFVVTPGSTTSYTINGSNSNGCISTTATDLTTTITVYATPISTASTTGSITCVTNTINLNSTLSGAGITYTWVAPGGSSISGSPNIQNAIGQGLGTYSLNLTGPGGCTYSTSIAAIQNITTPTSVDAGPNKTLVCITPTVSLLGSATPASAIANWLGGVSSPSTFTTSTGAAGLYILQAIEPTTGCFIFDTVRVFQSVISPTVTSNAVTNSITCVNSIVPIGISVTCPDPFTIAWPLGTGISGPTNTLTTTATLTGVYQVTVTNTFNSCISINSINVPIDQTPVPASISPASTITCTTPSITLSASPVGSTYTYTWTGSAAIVSGGSTQNPIVNTGGTYSVAITNTVNGCVGNANVTVASNTVAPVVSIASPTIQTTCSNPTATLNVSSTPTAGVTYSWTAPGTGSLNSSTISNPVASGSGIFTVVVTNTANGCSSSLTQNTVEVIPDLAIPVTTLSANSLSITCSNPTVTATISTTSTPVSYSWSPTSGIVSGTETTATPSFTAMGSYSVVVTNTASGCATSIGANVVTVSLDNTVPTISLTSGVNNGTVTCTNTFVTISPTVTPGSNLTYTWSPGNVSSGTLTSATFTAAGIYTLAVTNTVTGCVTSLTNTANSFTVIADNTAPTFTLGTAPTVSATCAVPNVTLSGTSSADPNSVYTWTTPSPSVLTGNPIIVSTAGIYTIAVTNTVNGCSSASIGQNTVEVVADAGIPSVTLSSNSLSITCSSQTVTATISTTATPVSYSWSPTTGIVPGTETTANPIFNAAGSYSSVVTNTASGCATGIGANVVDVVLDNTIPSTTLTTAAVNDGTLTCLTTSIVLTPTINPASSNLTYTWTPSIGILGSANQANATFTATGIYTLVITNTLTGCASAMDATSTFTVYENIVVPTFTLNGTPSVTMTCSTPNATLSGTSSADPNSIFTWTTPIPSTVVGNPIVVSTAGIYSVTVTNTVNGCSTSPLSQPTVEVVVDSGIPTVTLSSTTQTITCTNLTPTVSIAASTNSVSYSWTPIAGIVAGTEITATPSFSAIGSYSVIVTNTVSGCATSSVSNVVTITQNTTSPTMTLSSTVNDGTLTCSTTSINVTPAFNGTDLTYTWSPSAGISTPVNQANATFTAVGVYTLAVTNTLTGCVSITDVTSTFTVYQDTLRPITTITATSTNSTIGCGGSSSTVTLLGTPTTTNATTFNWLPVNIVGPTLNVVTADIYTLVTVDAVNSCTSSTEYTVVGNTSAPQGVDAGTTVSIACSDATITLTGTTTSSNVNYSWTGPSATSITSGSNTSNPVVTEVGDYTLTVTDNLTGCQSTATVTVSQAIATASITADPITGLSPLLVNFTGSGLGTLTYNWNFGDSNTSTVQNPSNTFNTGTYTVTLTTSSGPCIATATVLIIVEDGLTLEIPNVFTPNNDGSNDIFTIKSTGVKEISLQIFNRWGEKLYEFSGPKASWDGLTPNGGKVPEGTYFYFVKATGFDDKEIEKHGTMNLFR